MSDISDACRVQVLIADYAAADAAAKLNVLGAGIQVIGLQSHGVTAPHAVIVGIEVPPAFYGEDYSFELVLVDDNGNVVEHLDDVTGQASAIRIGQVLNAAIPNPQLPATLRFPRGAVWSRQQFLANFQAGIPLQAGRGYSWQVNVDGEHHAHWAADFYVPGPVSPLVQG